MIRHLTVLQETNLYYATTTAQLTVTRLFGSQSDSWSSALGQQRSGHGTTTVQFIIREGWDLLEPRYLSIITSVAECCQFQGHWMSLEQWWAFQVDASKVRKNDKILHTKLRNPNYYSLQYKNKKRRKSLKHWNFNSDFECDCFKRRSGHRL